MIYLDKDIEKYWAGKDPFREVDLIEGEVFRLVKNRRTLRFNMAGKSYFAKIHHGVGWKEIFKNIFMFKKPVISVQNEYLAIKKIERLDIATMEIAAYGKRGNNPAEIRSFIITKELKNTVSLEDFCKDWKKHPPAFSLKKDLIEYLAKVSRTLHLNGINHRDYYICHFLLDVSRGIENITAEKISIFLIDLHRAQIRRKTPFRWIVKDIGSLWFSAMDIGLTKLDRFRFIKIYSGKTLRELTKNDLKFWHRVQKRAEKLYAKELRLI